MRLFLFGPSLRPISSADRSTVGRSHIDVGPACPEDPHWQRPKPRKERLTPGGRRARRELDFENGRAGAGGMAPIHAGQAFPHGTWLRARPETRIWEVSVADDAASNSELGEFEIAHDVGDSVLWTKPLRGMSGAEVR